MHICCHICWPPVRSVACACHGAAAGHWHRWRWPGRAGGSRRSRCSRPAHRCWWYWTCPAGSAQPICHRRACCARAKVGQLRARAQGGQVGLWCMPMMPTPWRADRRRQQRRAVSGCAVAGRDAARWPACRPRHRLGNTADAADWCAAGQILLVSDQADGEAALAAAQARSLGLQVSVLGLGTPAGAAYRDGSGQIRQAALDEGSLRAVATAGGGRYARISADDSDLRALGVLDAREGTAQRPGEGKQWRDEGFWLLPPVMLLALLAFRRRALLAAVLAVGLVPWMNDAQAQAPATQASQPAQGTLWKRSDQAQHQRLAEGSRLTATATSPLHATLRRHRQRCRLVQPGQHAGTRRQLRRSDRRLRPRAGVASRHGRCGRQPCRGRCRAQAQAVRWQRPGSAEATAERAAEAAERCPGPAEPAGPEAAAGTAESRPGPAGSQGG